MRPRISANRSTLVIGALLARSWAMTSPVSEANPKECETLARTARHLHAQAARAWSSPAPPARTLPSLWFMTDAARVAEPWRVLTRLPRGSGVVLRDYQLPDRFLLAERLAKIARSRNLVLLVGADLALARHIRADGVHWPKWALKHRRVPRRSLPSGMDRNSFGPHVRRTGVR